MIGRSGAENPADAPAKRPVFSLRWIATLSAAGLVALTASIIVHVNERNLQETLIREAQTQLVLEARNLAMVSMDPLLSEFPELTLIPLVTDIRKNRPEMVDVTIIDHNCLIRGTVDPKAVGAPFLLPDDAQPEPASSMMGPGECLYRNGSTLLIKTPIRHPQNPNLGKVYLTLDTSLIDSKLAANRAALLKTTLMLLVLAVALTGVLMSLLFRPLGALRQGLERIGRGHLDTPMKVRDITELGMLAGTVNTMAGQLKASQALAEAREQEIVQTQKEVVNTLGQVVESRSSETANHTLRVGDMSYELALLAGLDPREAELIRMASPMHDVGKIGIPDGILNKPGLLDPAEYAHMQQHSEIGYRILAKSDRPILKAAAIIAHQHHERWDGMGYPRGLKGDDIHIYGRIVALVDVFDAISSDRVYRPAMPLERVLNIIQEERGHHFDPALVDLFLANLKRFLSISERHQDEGRTLLGAAASQPRKRQDDKEPSPVS